jgi:16S rRNA (cytidine1402-2'-O)-methyltransferase
VSISGTVSSYYVTGTLYLVATPIGNLEDITLRALRVLREVDLIACEDTRQTRHLLDHFGIAKPLLSYHDHNEAARAAELIGKLEAGANIALVTDAGTPLISDPGYRAAAAAIAAGIPVVPIPGASAVLTALAGSGLGTDEFRFCGFLPARSAARRKTLASFAGTDCTLIFYDSPRRIIETLEDVEMELGGRPVVVARELTKIHEEFLRGTAAEVRAQLAAKPSVKGEITLLLGRPVKGAEAEAGAGSGSATPEEEVRALEVQGLARMDAVKRVAKARGIPKRDLYSRVISQRAISQKD